jgi:FkbM family methyltransferase
VLKQFVQLCLGTVGLRISRLPQSFPAINVLRLAVYDAIRLHSAAGNDLSAFWVVQIGAHDGISFDPVHEYIVDNQLSALLVEPQPEIFQRLQDTYLGQGRIIFENAAIAKRTGTIPLYRFRAGPGVPYEASCLASLSKTEIERDLHEIRGEIEEISVPAFTLSDLLDRHSIQRIGLLQLDTEGFDFEIIKMIEFSRWKPVLINFEDGFADRSQRKDCLSFLADHGYRMLKNGIDIVAYQQQRQETPFATRKLVTTLD